MDENEYPEKIVIYSTELLKERDSMGGPEPFIPVFDTTDHLHFACRKCKRIADVVEVYRYDSVPDKHSHIKGLYPTIFFKLACPKCKVRGQRKIYPERRESDHLQYPTQTEFLMDIEKAGE